MMDEATLDRYANFAVAAGRASYEEVAGLTKQEWCTYRRVSANGLLLEQEKIPHAHAVQEIEAALRPGRVE